VCRRERRQSPLVAAFFDVAATLRDPPAPGHAPLRAAE
jgi:hypothetical protein